MKGSFNESFYVGLCWHCKSPGSTGQPLQRCGGCQLVPYCSRECQRENRSSHKFICKEFPVVNGKNSLHTTGIWEIHIAGLRQRASRLPHAQENDPIFQNPWVCNTCRETSPSRLTNCKCDCVSYCSKRCSNTDRLHTQDCHILDLTRQLYVLTIRRVSYPMSLTCALNKMSEGCYFGSDNVSLEDLTSLVIHVVTSSTMLDSYDYEEELKYYWENGFAYEFPQIKHLEVVFILQGKAFKPSTNPQLSQRGYWNDSEFEADWKAENRIVTYTFQHMLYHMFFSSPEYTEPDIVVVYDNTQEMSSGSEEAEAIHSEISYCNMTYSPDTVLVLMDATKDLLNQGVRAVNAVRPVEILVSPKRNPIGKGLNFTCLRKK